ncbi:MAG: glycosyltransferase, partial [Chthoniobacterales bacterium]
MFEALPSLRGFQPKFYSGGAARFHLPLFYDLIAAAKPKRAVALGFGDGDAFFTFCQAAVEQRIDCDCVAVRQDRAGESEEDDAAWSEGKNNGEEFYGTRARFFADRAAALKAIDDGSVDILLINDSDSGREVAADLSSWTTKLSPNGIVLLHGLQLERGDSPATAWNQWAGKRLHAKFPAGLGLGMAVLGNSEAGSFFLKHSGDLAVLYSVAATRIDAVARAAQAEKQAAASETRQVWLDSLLTDRRRVQEIMDHQAREIGYLQQAPAELRHHLENLRTDRAKAQLIMDAQHEQLQRWIAQADALKAKIETLKTQLKDYKAILNAAKQACRKGGRCFQIDPGPKKRRPWSERITRELRRLPRNLGFGKKETAPAPQSVEVIASSRPADRYETWIAEHEPDVATLENQRKLSREFAPRIKISLLTPVRNTPATFLEEMFASVAAQTYDNWELCIVDAGSDRAQTVETLPRWEARDERIRLERLDQNFGIAENTNRALKMATGDFVACLDHDDVLAPFALYELARAAMEFPDADILYSDEDRLSEKGKRHAPFFKPEWDLELLCASMYIGHLSAYRRSLVFELGGFRKEFDLSQDYDLALRGTERAKSIRHIPHVLYHWREHPESGSTGGKPDARRTNLAALVDALRRRNLPAEILEYPTANRTRLKIERWPRVSIIIPTDSPTRAQACLQELPQATRYPDLEIVLITNSQLADSLTFLTESPQFLERAKASIRFVPYDKPFNFSDKCNFGAAAATGERLIFFNDDVETAQTDWIQNLIEPLENPEIGAVAPKLLYESGKIQHAGLVMGVRGLAGTAFHQRPADSPEHFNLAQTLHDVAALSAACLAMRREDFFRVGEFDAINAPIAHSDMDLCFKVREAGLRCVYTPYATLRHAGHASIGLGEAQLQTQRKPRDKANIFMLKRWAGYTTHDPFFPDNMRDWLHVDSPTPIRMWGRNDPAALIKTSADLLFV